MTAMQNDEGGLQLLTLGGDGDLGYHDTGQGEAIVLVHAGVFSDWFRPLSRHLPRDRFRVVRTRRSGYRGSAPPGRHLGLADHARHAARLLDALGTGPAHWVGHSSSCLIGLQLAQDRPDLVASLSLLEPAPGGDLHGPADEQFVATTVRPAMEEFFAGDPAAAFDRFTRGIGGDHYPAVVTSQLGPDSLDAARAATRRLTVTAGWKQRSSGWSTRLEICSGYRRGAAEGTPAAGGPRRGQLPGSTGPPVPARRLLRAEGPPLRQRLRALKAVEVTLALVAAGLAAVAAISPSVGAWAAVVMTAGGAVAAYIVSERYEFLWIEYNRTASELRRLLDRRTAADGRQLSDSELVVECEQVISVQNQAWMAKWGEESPASTD